MPRRKKKPPEPWPQYKTFEGRKHHLNFTTDKKTDAKAAAKWLKKAGIWNRARVVSDKRGRTSKDYPRTKSKYAIYGRPKDWDKPSSIHHPKRTKKKRRKR